tara:strand:- start:227 stop:796 length:570 start_codon:yes stop_codon:yes gene_type:complete
MRTVVAPIGGAGNHVRWLCLLDHSFDLTTVSKSTATNSEFMLNTVYNEQRNNSNWLRIEFIWRDQLRPFIDLHNDIEAISEPDHRKILYVSSPGQQCYDHYWKFDKPKQFQDRMQDKSQWIDRVDEQNQNINKLLPDPVVLHFGRYYTEQIDQQLLDQLNDCFGINIPFAEADAVHNRWLELNHREQTG